MLASLMQLTIYLNFDGSAELLCARTMSRLLNSRCVRQGSLEWQLHVANWDMTLRIPRTWMRAAWIQELQTRPTN